MRESEWEKERARESERVRESVRQMQIRVQTVIVKTDKETRITILHKI